VKVLRIDSSRSASQRCKVAESLSMSSSLSRGDLGLLIAPMIVLIFSRLLSCRKCTRSRALTCVSVTRRPSELPGS